MVVLFRGSCFFSKKAFRKRYISWKTDFYDKLFVAATESVVFNHTDSFEEVIISFHFRLDRRFYSLV